MQTLVSLHERMGAMELSERYRDILRQRYQLAPPTEMTELYHAIQTPPKQSDRVMRTGATPDCRDDTGGAVPLDSKFYLERPADTAFQAAIARGSSIVLVKGPRQTGKTSLLARGLHQAKQNGMRVVLTDFQKISAEHWASTNTLYQALARGLIDHLELDLDLNALWRPAWGANENFERFLRKTVLETVTTPLVWGMDEVDRLFAYPYSTEVFALFRSWHNERSLDPDGPWERLTLAIAYATEPHLFISDLNQSPFNVGTRLHLEDFTLEQADMLNQFYGSPLSDGATVARLYAFLGGNPYLLQRGLQEITSRSLALPVLEAQAVQEDGCFGDHLQRLLLAVSKEAGLAEAVRSVLHGNSCPSPESFYRLRSAGLLVGPDPAQTQVRCQLYQIYLEAHLW